MLLMNLKLLPKKATPSRHRATPTQSEEEKQENKRIKRRETTTEKRRESRTEKRDNEREYWTERRE